MNRRNFIKSTAVAGMAIGTLPGISGCMRPEELDQYGGWTGKKFDATGFFRIVKDDRWWFVSPEGNAFLSFGINHYHAGWWSQDYNTAYWNERFGAAEAGDDTWWEGFRTVASADMKRLGINTLGWHTDAPSLTDKSYGAVVPYFRSYKPIVLDHYFHPGEKNFMDIFAPEFEKICNKKAIEVATPYVDDPMLVGYCMSDCPIFTDNDIKAMGGSTTWSRILPNLGPGSPGKQAYVEAMKSRYADIGKFNATYSTSFASWDALAETTDWKPNIAFNNTQQKQDDEIFTLLCVEKYYEVAKAALRKVDPNHLFLGDKLNGNTNNLDKVLEVAAKYADVIVFQFYGMYEAQKALLDKQSPRVDIPFLNGDIGFSVPTEMMPNPYGPHAKDQAERASWLIESCEGCFARPEFIGYHMCGVIDTWKTMPGKETHQHQGIMTVKGEFYPEMEKALKTISSGLYKYPFS